MSQFLKGRFQSFLYACAGIGYVFRTQKNAQIQLVISALVLILAVWLALPAGEFVVILLTVGMVLAAEFFNTALEAVVDLVSPDNHPLAKIAKDVGAGAVLVLAFIAVIIGILILGPPLLLRLNLLHT